MASRFEDLLQLGMVPCSVCRTPTSTAELTEQWVPGAVTQWGFSVETAIWVCPNCPRVG